MPHVCYLQITWSCLLISSQSLFQMPVITKDFQNLDFKFGSVIFSPLCNLFLSFFSSFSSFSVLPTEFFFFFFLIYILVSSFSLGLESCLYSSCQILILHTESIHLYTHYNEIVFSSFSKKGLIQNFNILIKVDKKQALFLGIIKTQIERCYCLTLKHIF